MRLTLSLAVVALLLAVPPTAAQLRTGDPVLDAQQVVPPTSEPGTCNPFGSAMSLDLATNTLTWSGVAFYDLGSPSTSLHLHEGAAGVNGPEILDMGPVVVVSASNDALATAGSTVLTPDQAAAVLAGETYVILKTVDFPDGALRAQVALPWEDLGGAHGEGSPQALGPPLLETVGTLYGGSEVRLSATNLPWEFTLFPPFGNQALLILSLGPSTPAPYFSGTFHAFPFTATVPFATVAQTLGTAGTTGAMPFTVVTWPSGIPSGTVGVLQILVVDNDPSVPGDFAITNAVQFTTP